MAPKMDTKRHVFKEIELHAQNMISILGSTVNIIGRGLPDERVNMRNFTFMLNKLFI